MFSTGIFSGFGSRRELIGKCVEDFSEEFGLFVVEDDDF